MVRVQSMRVMEVLAEATNIIAEGEVLQLLNCHDASITDEAYLKVIHYKTAKLFEAATRLGAIINDASESDERAMAEYGMRLGTAFQLIDDVLDLSGDSAQIGKNWVMTGRGKPTLPLLFAMRRARNTAQHHQSCHRKRRAGGITRRDPALQNGALDHVRKIAKKEADIGYAPFTLPDSDYLQALRIWRFLRSAAII